MSSYALEPKKRLLIFGLVIFIFGVCVGYLFDMPVSSYEDCVLKHAATANTVLATRLADDACYAKFNSGK